MPKYLKTEPKITYAMVCQICKVKSPCYSIREARSRAKSHIEMTGHTVNVHTTEAYSAIKLPLATLDTIKDAEV